MPAARNISAIRVTGARQNNLKGIDVDIPLGQLTVVTGASGSGKSSLAFETLYAEGQRRYVETFSPYTRQFFDRMDKPRVDSIEGIPPAIAIEQQNAVKSTRSTVGTITEINEYLKLLFPRICKGYDPVNGAEIEPETPESILRKGRERFGGDAAVLVLFPIAVPQGASKQELFDFLQQQGYLRVALFGEVFRTDEPAAYQRKIVPAEVDVVQDRLKLSQKSRFLEAVETALILGKGRVTLAGADLKERMAFAKGWTNPETGTVLPEPFPNLFSFNHPVGACPECRGFGRVIGIDVEKALPDKSLSISEGVVRPFLGDSYYECQEDLERCARRKKISLVTPYDELSKAEQEWILSGEGGDEEALWESGMWYGVKGFFRWLEKRSYKMHVRILLSRYRSYTTCDVCRGTRLKPGVLNFRINGKTLPDLWQLPIDELLAFFDQIQPPKNDRAAQTIHADIRNRLFYLTEVGLSYLNLDRPTRTLSGGEIERVNLTTCLGANLTGTLFVLDEPTVGLHARDVSRLIGVMHRLRDLGNTLVVVEHEESVIRAADYLIDIGPGRGESGGEMVYFGKGCPDADSAARALARHKHSMTLQYLSGAKSIEAPSRPRKPDGWLEIRRASQHNLNKIDVKIPLGVLCCVSGVSGSGKSTLVNSVLYENAIRELGHAGSDEAPGACQGIRGLSRLENIVMVDQNPMAKTTRSTPAVYIGVFDPIRQLFAESVEGRMRSIQPGYFSFNSGIGRCARCQGAGFEKVEMQFLSDLFVTCPECEGKRYTKEALEITLEGKNIDEVLNLTAETALEFFSPFAEDPKIKKIRAGLNLLAEVGLGYLRLGQPVTTLSGGESQRLKLVGHLLESRPAKRKKKGPLPKTTLLIFDEPTTGLHFDDVRMLLAMFDRLVESGDSVLVIEHNLDVIRHADHVLELGPGGGIHGGNVIFTGTPKELAAQKDSETGRFLAGKREKSSAKVAEPAQSTGYTVATYPVHSVPAQGAGIVLSGARENNLKNIDLVIPRDQFVVITGLSGSGKSTLAFDILFAEGQRRFLDSMSTYARQFVEQMERPDIDQISGLPPTVAIEQRISRGGGKSTVATVTEVWHFLRLLYSKVGIQYSPDTGNRVQGQSVTAIITQLREAAREAGRPLSLMAPLVRGRKGYHIEVAEWAARNGYSKLFVDNRFIQSDNFTPLARFQEHWIDVVIAEIDEGMSAEALLGSLENALKLGKGTARYLDGKKKIQVVSTQRCDPETGRSFDELDPRLFSYNSPHGYCPVCRGYGSVVKYAGQEIERQGESLLEMELNEEMRRAGNEEVETMPCASCHGSRLNEVARHVRVGDRGIHEIAAMPIRETRLFVESLKFTGSEAIITRDILPEISQRLHFMEEVGLGYLQLDRSATTLSGGESQRIRLAAQLGSNLRGVLYVLDEPTIGLHPRDNAKLLDTLRNLQKKGNSLVVVEHDDETIQRSDYVIDLGPGAGELGGEVVWQGKPSDLAKISASEAERSPTARALRHKLNHPLRGQRRALPAQGSPEGWIRIEGARANNLKNIHVRIPLGRLTVIAGISGSGKSSFMRGVLKPAVEQELRRQGKKEKADAGRDRPWKSIAGAEYIEAIYEVDQSPIGKTSRSTPATYVKVFDEIRKVFAQLPESRARGYTASRFSFNTEGGRCEPCKGNGHIKLEMNFLPTSYVECDECHGRRYNSATLEVLYNGKSIADVMDMSIAEAAHFFESHSKIHRTLSLMADTGLNYLRLGQPSPTVSGGEAQRIKLVTELTRGIGRAANARLRQNRTPKSNLYLIEEPSIGLHHEDVVRLIEILHRLVDDGHTVVVIEHCLEIMAEADYLIEIGPEAGEEGGKIVAAGKPETVIRAKESRTGEFLAKLIG